MGALMVTFVEKHYIGIPLGDVAAPEDWSKPFTDPQGRYWACFQHYVDYFHEESIKHDGGAHLRSREMVEFHYQK